MGAKVTVACKIAIPYLDLQLCERKVVVENSQTGPRDVVRWDRTGKIVRIRGTAYPRGTPPEGFPEKPTLVAGFALTPDVDKEFWDEWLKQNAKAAYVTSGMLMAYEKLDTVKGVASDFRSEVSGLEPMRPDRDPRMPRPTQTGVSKLETEEGRRAKIEQAARAVA